MSGPKRKVPQRASVATARRKRKKKAESNASPNIPQGQGIGKCQFCRLYFRDAQEHETRCSRNPDRKRSKSKKIGHGRKGRFPVPGKPGSAKKRRIRAAGEREAAKLSLEIVHGAYNPSPKSSAVMAASVKPKPAPIKIASDSASKNFYGGIVRCKFCDHPAMPGDEICRDHSSE
jgi:hypothetical protein